MTLTRVELEREQRQRILAALLAELQRAREQRAPWYVETLRFIRRWKTGVTPVPYNEFPDGY